MSYEFRKKTQVFRVPSGFKAFHCIEVRMTKGRWELLGDDSGILKYETEEERDNKLKELEESV